MKVECPFAFLLIHSPFVVVISSPSKLRLLKKSCFYQKWPLRFQFLTMLQDRGTNNRDMKNWINLLFQQPQVRGGRGSVSHPAVPPSKLEGAGGVCLIRRFPPLS